jgi:hypothetical protein
MESVLATGGLRSGRPALVRYLPGTGNMAVRAERLRALGPRPFNEAFHDSGEDKEMLYRLRAAGARLRYVPSASVWHHRTRSLGVHARKMYWCGLRRVDIWRELRGTMEAAHVVPALITLLTVLVGAAALAGNLPARGMVGLGTALLLLDGVWAARRLRDPRAVGIVPLSSALIVLGYGMGIWARWLQIRKPPG